MLNGRLIYLQIGDNFFRHITSLGKIFKWFCMNPFKEDKVFFFFLHFLCTSSVLADNLFQWNQGQKGTHTRAQPHTHTNTHFIQLSVVF